MLAASGTFHGQWIVRDAGSNAVRFASFTIQPIAAYGTSTSNTITGDRKTFRTDSDGRVTVSNLFNGRSYRVQITGPNFTTTFTNSFDTNVTGLVNGADYISAPIRDAGLVAYSQTQADARFLRTNISHIVRPGDNITITTNGAGPSQYLTISASGGGGGSSTFYPGQSTTWRTLGGSNVVDVTGTLTNSTTGNAATATLATNAIKLTGPLTNGMNYGSAFRSTGAGAFSEQFGYNAGADGEYALAVGYGSSAAGDGALAIGPDTIASQPNAIALGNGATATGNASVAIGAGVTADTANTIKLGTATHAVITEGTNVAALFVGDGVGVTNLSGTNIASGTIAPARLGSGSGGATKFLREDSTWQTVSGGGSTEYFYPGQSTTWRTVGGSNVVDVVGTLTNNTTGNADTATTATNANIAGVNRGQVWSLTNEFAVQDRVRRAMPTPIKWWGTWNDYGAGYPTYITNVSETNIILQAYWMKTNGLWDAGYRWISIQEGWQAGLNPDGTFAVTNRFPNGMKWLVSYLRDLGFKTGIYTGINADEPATTCMGYVGTSYTNLLNHMRQFKDWGIEWVFFDSCQGYGKWTQAPAGTVVAETGMETDLFRERARVIQHAIEVAQFTNPPIVLLSPPQVGSTNIYGTLFADEQATRYANIWPIHPTNNWDFLTGGFQDVAKYYITNCLPAARLTGPGYAQYGYIIPSYQPLDSIPVACGFQTILPATSSFESGGARENFWVDPVTYPPSTWNFLFPNDPRTNVLAWIIQSDPAVIPGQLVYSNDSAVVISRPFGNRTSNTNTLLVINWKSSSQTIQIPHRWMGVRDAVPLSYYNIYTNTTVAANITSNLSFTVGSSNCYLLFSYPSEVNDGNFEQVIGFKVAGLIAADSTSRNDYESYGPAPWYNNEGMQQISPNPGSSYMRWSWPAPPGATNALLRYQVYSAYAGTVRMSNYPGVNYNGPSGRIALDPTSDARLTNAAFTLTSGNYSWVTNYFEWDKTNTSVFLQSIIYPSSNSSSRYIIGPMYVKYGYAE